MLALSRFLELSSKLSNSMAVLALSFRSCATDDTRTVSIAISMVFIAHSIIPSAILIVYVEGFFASVSHRSLAMSEELSSDLGMSVGVRSPDSRLK